MHIDESAAPGCECLTTFLVGKVTVHDCRVLCYFSGTLSSSEIFYSVYRVLKYYSNVEYTQHRPHEKIDFFVRSVLFFATARIFKLTRQVDVESHTSQMPSRKACGR